MFHFSNTEQRDHLAKFVSKKKSRNHFICMSYHDKALDQREELFRENCIRLSLHIQVIYAHCFSCNMQQSGP